MITVYQQSLEYCKEKNLPTFSRNHLRDIGAMCAIHFKKFWGINQPAKIIKQAGFILTEEEGRKLLVIGYPNSFAPEITGRIDEFLKNKKEAAEKKAEDIKSILPKKRKRIPITRKMIL